MSYHFANDPASGVVKTRGDPPGLSTADQSHASSAADVRPSFSEIAEMLARLHATHAALGATQYRVSQLVRANLMLERHARALAEELDHTRRLALHDPLTGLANRALLADRLELAILRARREELHLAVMLLDLDGFKAVNDVYGHAAGDEVLCETARRARGAIRACDTACRFGGDEFVILLSNIAAREDAEAVAEKVRSEIAKPLVLAERTLSITATVGMSIYPTDGRTADELLKHADRAMNGTRKPQTATAALMCGSAT